ncbi:hypothetical protein [Paraburkholderia sp. JHI869]|uniref:hypothetical protein n=1 Tax=Paraburkholderia sp. JHI869 TaxID=3112959 RepID=UPI00316E469B
MNAIEIYTPEFSVKFALAFGSGGPELNVVHRVGSPRTRSYPDSHRQAGKAWRFFSVHDRTENGIASIRQRLCNISGSDPDIKLRVFGKPGSIRFDKTFHFPPN